MHDGSSTLIGNFFRKKWVRLILVVDIIIIIIIIAIPVGKATKTATVNFNVVPTDSTITINGSSDYKSNGQAYSLTPGTYEIQISHAELDAKTLTVNLEADHNTTVTTFLSKDGNFYFYTLRSNYGFFNELASIASSENNQTTDHDTSAEKFIKKMQHNIKLYQEQLPINDVKYDSLERNYRTVYDITIRQASGSSSCLEYLCVEAFMIFTDDKSIVESILKEKGFNLEDLKIEYKTYL